MSATSRHREKAPEPETIDWLQWYDGSELNGGPLISYQEVWIMDDFVDESFHARVRDGEVFCNPCDLTVEKRYHGPPTMDLSYWWTADPTKPYVPTQGNFTHRQLTQVSWSEWDVNQCDVSGSDSDAMAKHYALANVDSTPYEFMEDLAEVRETIEFLKSPLKSIKNVMRAFKRKRDKIMSSPVDADRVKALSALWKQYRFALAPLVRSVMSASEALLKFEDIERPPRRTAHGFAHYPAQPVDSEREVWSRWGTDTWHRHFAISDTAETNSHASIYYEVSNPLVDWKFALGLRLKDIPTTAWEIVPLSFMADRLLNIKGMIQGLVNIADPTVTFLSGAIVTKTDTQRVLCCDAFWSSYSVLEFDIRETDEFFIENFTYTRRLWDPSLRDTLPRFTPEKLIESVVNTLDLISIIVGMMKY